MTQAVHIPNGAILNCYLPKKRGSLKRAIMNAEAQLIKKKFGFEKLLNHTALIERQNKNVLIWEASVKRGIAPTELSLYTSDAFFIITTGTYVEGSQAMDTIKSQSGVPYDFRSWLTYLKYIISGDWDQETNYKQYSKKWFCSEIVDEAHKLSSEPFKSTPNHVYNFTRSNEIWSGTYNDLVYGIKQGSIKVGHE